MRTETKIPGMIRVNDGSEEEVREYGYAMEFPADMPEEGVRSTLLDHFASCAANIPGLASKTPEIIQNLPRQKIVGDPQHWAWYVCDWFPR